MPEHIAIISSDNYENILRKAIAFDVVSTVIQSVVPSKWDKILPVICCSNITVKK